MKTGEKTLHFINRLKTAIWFCLFLLFFSCTEMIAQPYSNLFITYTNAAGPRDISSGKIWKYKLSAGTWTDITPSGYTCGFGGISVDPNNPDRLVASTLNIYSPQSNPQV